VDDEAMRRAWDAVAMGGRRGVPQGEVAARAALEPDVCWQAIRALLAAGRLYWRNPRDPYRLLAAPWPEVEGGQTLDECTQERLWCG